MALFSQQLEQLEVRVLESTAGQKFLAWYRGQSDRDQGLFKLMMFAVVSLLVVLTLIIPPAQFAAGALGRYEQAAADYTWLQARQSEAKELGSRRAQPRDAQTITSLLNSTAGQQGIQIAAQQVRDEGSVDVTLEGMPFNNVLRWMDVLATEHGLQATRVRISAESQPGLVRARLELQE